MQIFFPNIAKMEFFPSLMLFLPGLLNVLAEEGSFQKLSQNYKTILGQLHLCELFSNLKVLFMTTDLCFICLVKNTDKYVCHDSRKFFHIASKSVQSNCKLWVRWAHKLQSIQFFSFSHWHYINRQSAKPSSVSSRWKFQQQLFQFDVQLHRQIRWILCRWPLWWEVLFVWGQSKKMQQ